MLYEAVIDKSNCETRFELIVDAGEQTEGNEDEPENLWKPTPAEN